MCFILLIGNIYLSVSEYSISRKMTSEPIKALKCNNAQKTFMVKINRLIIVTTSHNKMGIQLVINSENSYHKKKGIMELPG